MPSSSRRLLVLAALSAAALVAVMGPTPARAADPVPLYNAGIAAKKAGDLAAAEVRFRDCLAVDPAYGRCHFSLGVLLKKRDALGDAEKHFRAALAAYPTWGQAHFSLGMTLLKRGLPEAARPELEQAIADPDLDTADRAESWNALGVLHRQAGRLDEALAAFDKAIAQAPLPRFHQNRAMVLERLARWPEAEAAARQAIALDAADARSWTLLGRALAIQKRPADAVPAWKKVTELAPGDAEGFYGLGEAAEAVGDKPLARASFERWLALAPADVDKAPMRQRLERLK